MTEYVFSKPPINPTTAVMLLQDRMCWYLTFHSPLCCQNIHSDVIRLPFFLLLCTVSKITVGGRTYWINVDKQLVHTRNVKDTYHLAMA